MVKQDSNKVQPLATYDNFLSYNQRSVPYPSTNVQLISCDSGEYLRVYIML